MMIRIERKGHTYTDNTLYDKAMRLFLALFVVVPVNYGIGPLNLPRLFSLAIVVLFMFRNKTIKLKPLRRNNILFWAFIILHIVQLLFGGSVLIAVSYFLSYFLVTYICIIYFDCESKVYKFIDDLIIVATVLSLIGMIESVSGRYLIQGSILNAEKAVRYGFLRCAATFGHPIGFGLFQACIALLAFYRISTVNSKKRRKRFIVCYIAIVVSCFLTVSRLAMCFYAAGQVLLAFKMGVNKFIKYLMFVVLFFTVALTVLDIAGIDLFGSLISDFVVSFENMFLGADNVTSSDTVGFGNRMDLYGWVIKDVGNDWLFGKGAEAQFAYKMYDWFTKTSIEVQYLNIFYNFGLVGVVSLVISYIGNIVYMSKKNIGKFDSEKKLVLSSVLLIIFVIYYICLFGVQETDTLRIYCILIALGIAYKNILQRKRMKEDINETAI